MLSLLKLSFSSGLIACLAAAPIFTSCRSTPSFSGIKQDATESVSIEQLRIAAKQAAVTALNITEQEVEKAEISLFKKIEFNTTTGGVVRTTYVAYVSTDPSFALVIIFKDLTTSVEKILPSEPNLRFDSKLKNQPYIPYTPGIISFKVGADVTQEHAIALAKSIDGGREPSFDYVLWNSKRIFWNLPVDGHYKERFFIEKLRANRIVISASTSPLGRNVDIKSEFFPLDQVQR